MHHRLLLLSVHLGLVLASALTIGAFTASARVTPLYAIRGARVVTAAGPVIERGTVVMRNGVIEDVGAGVTLPTDAVVVDGAGAEIQG